MARFYGQLQGNRGMTSRMGNAYSGIWAHIRGWNIGTRVTCHTADEIDLIEVHATHGSTGGERDIHLATLRYNPNGGHYSIIVNKNAHKEV